AVHADERRTGELRFPGRERAQHERGPLVGGVDLRVVAGGANESDVANTDEAWAPLVGMEEEIVVPVSRRPAISDGSDRRTNAPQRLGKTYRINGLQQVVDGVNLEGPDGVSVERRDEHGAERPGAARE